MRAFRLRVVLGCCLLVASGLGCSSASKDEPATGGTTGVTGGTTGVTGGTTGVTGGTTGTGASPMTGGSTSTGGVTATAGKTGTTGGAGGAVSMTGGTTAGGAASGPECPTENEEKFSFFLISNAELIRQGGADSTGMFSKYGGNFGGLEGADGICQEAADHVSPCQSKKVWRAFLSTPTVDAIDRIGSGPWYDRLGRLWASNKTTLVGDRPTDADPAIKNDIPNETGTKNQNPDGTGSVDNHQILTGSGPDGRAYEQSDMGDDRGTSCGPDVGGSDSTWSAERATCWGWTRNTPEGCPRVGHSWCINASCTPPGSSSGTNWLSVWNESGCEAGGVLTQTGFPEDERNVGSFGGYGGFYCFAVMGGQ